VVVILLSVVYNAPQFAEREAYEETVGCGDGDVRTRWRTKKTDVFGPIYYVVYKTICYVVFRAVGPLVVLLVLNARLVLALNRLGRRRRRRLNRAPAVIGDDRPTSAAADAIAVIVTSTPSTDYGNRQRLSARVQRRNYRDQRENITLMLVIVVFVFIVCQLPDLGLRITASLVCFLSMPMRLLLVYSSYTF